MRDQFNSWVGSFQSVGTLMKRLDIGEGNYMMELEEDYNILNAVSTIQEAGDPTLSYALNAVDVTVAVTVAIAVAYPL